MPCRLAGLRDTAGRDQTGRGAFEKLILLSRDTAVEAGETIKRPRQRLLISCIATAEGVLAGGLIVRDGEGGNSPVATPAERGTARSRIGKTFTRLVRLVADVAATASQPENSRQRAKRHHNSLKAHESSGRNEITEARATCRKGGSGSLPRHDTSDVALVLSTSMLLVTFALIARRPV